MTVKELTVKELKMKFVVSKIENPGEYIGQYVPGALYVVEPYKSKDKTKAEDAIRLVKDIRKRHEILVAIHAQKQVVKKGKGCKVYGYEVKKIVGPLAKDMVVFVCRKGDEVVMKKIIKNYRLME